MRFTPIYTGTNPSFSFHTRPCKNPEAVSIVQRARVELRDLVIDHAITDCYGITAHLAVLDVGLRFHTQVKHHGDALPTVGTTKELFFEKIHVPLTCVRVVE